MWNNSCIGGGSGSIDPNILEQINKNTADIVELKESSALYTNLSPSNVKVGALETGTVFRDVPMKDVFDAMLYDVIGPTLTAPSFTFTHNTTPLIEVGVDTNIRFTTTFSRGRISPAYTTSGYRSGLPKQYIYTGDLLEKTVDTTALSDIQDIAFKSSTAGTFTWSCSVSYSEGEQPVDSSGANFNSPLPEGKLTAKSLSVDVVYPYYAPTVDITISTKQPLIKEDYFEVTLDGETDTDKQFIEYSETLPELTGIEFYNDITRAWEWLRGSKENSKLLFTKSSIQKNGMPYNRYTNNSQKVGSRQLRFYLI